MAAKCKREQEDSRHHRCHKAYYAHRAGQSSEPVVAVCNGTYYEETEVLREVGKSWTVEHKFAQRDNYTHQVTYQRQRQNENANTAIAGE